ncbi:hypothetical protein VTO42DRAFT_1479 [Malbranchea cinnamomea]
MSGPGNTHGLEAGSLSSCYSDKLKQTTLPSKPLNVDDRSDFEQCQKLLKNENTRNFVVDFNREQAYCAFDLDEQEFRDWLESSPVSSIDARWITIWAPEKQKEIITILTERYKISRRLRSMMSSDPSVTKKYTPISPRLTSNRQSMQTKHYEEKTTIPDINELENGYSHALNGPVELAATGLDTITFSQIVNQIWHFVSVDDGEKYMCIGYNSLYVVPGVDFQNQNGYPDGKRMWAWLILCDDDTVILIQENPFPHPEKFDIKDRQRTLGAIRHHTTRVFSELSKLQSEARNANPLVTTQVRSFPNQSSVQPEESSNLLFYCLFDDWVSSYSLVIRKEHSYSTALEELRKGMLERAQVNLIDDLHSLGRQLGVLRRIYQSYELILTRILKRQRQLREEKRNNGRGITSHRMNTMPRVFGSREETWRSLTSDELDPSAPGGVELVPAAFKRFERLLDRIKLYALSEIDECIREKEALTFLVFNLIAVKDSQVVERLTRITILLAKVTILFLPVSLMTAYFSTEIQELQNYTARTYWIAFAVIMFLSIVLLVLFGWLSGTVEGRPIYRSIAGAFYDASMNAMGRRRKGHAE